MMRRYAQLPDPPSGAPLGDVFSIVIPVARTNIVTNGSFETDSNGWTAIGASIARSTAAQYHGAYSLAITPTSSTGDGVRFDTVSLVSGTTYAVSAKVLGASGVAYKLTVHTTAGTELIKVSFRGTGRWQWIWLYYTETSTTTRRVEVLKDNDRSTVPFYIDGVQVEALGSLAETVSTYIDGDQQGLVPNQQPPAYLWTGTPHASTSSRSGLTRAGGMVVKFKDYNLLLTAIIGLGLALPQNVKTEYARLDGAYDDYTRKPTRQFTLTGQFQGRSYQELRQNRSGIAQLLDRDLVGLDQRMTLLHHIEGPCNDIQTNESRVLCKYQGGLGGNTDNQVLENAAISFEQYLPYVQSDGEAGGALSVQQSVANANNLIYVNPSGTLTVFGTGGNLTAAAVLFGDDTYLYVGGNFTSFNGVASTRGIARIDTATGTVTAMGTGGPNPTSVNRMAKGPDGHIWVVGNFASMGGAANSGGVAEWTGSAWVGHTYPGTTNVFGAVFDALGNLYVCNVSGAVHKWDGAAWTLLGTATGADTTARDVRVGPDGNLYLSGAFDGIAAVATTARIARYTLRAAAPAWQALSGTAPFAGVAGSIYYRMAFGLNGILYVGMTDGAGNPALYQWNGVQFTSIGAIAGGSVVQTTFTMTNGLIALGGRFNSANGVTLADGAGFWNGAAVVPFNVDFPGTATLVDIAQRYDGALAYAFNTTGSATAYTTTTVTNTGTGKTYPTLRITGPTSGTSRIYELRNLTTGRSIYLNYTINAGETALLQFTPDNLSFVSSFVGNIANTILPGSNEADFFLQPGANVVSFFSADSTVVAVLYWRPCFVSLDDVR